MGALPEATLTIWDSRYPAPPGLDVVLWREFGADANVRSLPDYIEHHADALRARFLAWVHDLGELRIRGQRLIDRLELRPEFSFWWMTLLSEKSNLVNSPQLINVLKMLALEQWIGPDWRGSIVLVTDNSALARAMSGWCRRASISFLARKARDGQRNGSWWRRVMLAAPQPAHAASVFVRYLVSRWPLRRAGGYGHCPTDSRITVCSYLFNLDRGAAKLGRFVSSFWTELHALLECVPGGTNWFLQFVPHEFVPTARRARDLIRSFNEAAADRQRYLAIDGVLGLRVAAGALRDYLRVCAAALRLGSVRNQVVPRGSRLDLWPLIEGDWRASFFGSAAMFNCLYLNLFEHALRRLPRQEFGVYLQENIAWEIAWIHCWHAAGHGTLVGVPHSTVRFWDLRYFFDSRTLHRGGRNALPLPDVVAVNGPVARQTHRAAGFPIDRLVDVEALRYLYLLTVGPSRAPPAADSPLRVLILGDYVPQVTRRQMDWLVEAATVLPADTRYIVKAHPACPISAADYSSVDVQIADLPLDQLLRNCDVAYTGNRTSAAVEAYSLGVPVVSMLEGESLNVSPLRGRIGVTYVHNAAELGAALARARTLWRSAPDEYFWLDPTLPRWRELLRLGGPRGAGTVASRGAA